MKKILGLSFVLLLVSTSVVSAQTTKTSSPVNTTTGIENNLSVKQSPTAERKIWGKLKEDREKTFRELFADMLLKFNATVTRLEALIAKAELRVTEEKAGKPNSNLTVSEANLERAKEKLEEAKTNIDNAKIQVENVMTSENPKEEFAELRLLIADIKSDLQEVKRLLGSVVVQVKKIEAVKSSPTTTTKQK